MIELKDAIAIAKKECGAGMKLYNICLDVEGAYVFNAVTKDGRALSSGLALLVNKETGGKHYENYLPLPGNRLAELAVDGKPIDISDMLQKPPIFRSSVVKMNTQPIYSGIMGLVVGDALGVPVEFNPRDTFEVTDMTGYGTYDVPAGTWSDDSSMMLATVESIARLGKIDPDDIMKNFVRWVDEGAFTPYGEMFDIGRATRNAIQRYIQGMPATQCGGTAEWDNGNGSLMRILPLVFTNCDFDVVNAVSCLTHAHEISKSACRIYIYIARQLLKGRLLKDILESMKPAPHYFEGLSTLDHLQRNHIKSTGYVVDTLEAALWCVLKSNSYRECVLLAVNLGDDTDTVAAVAGGLAGVIYGIGGEKGIPEEWIAQIARKEWIKELCGKFEKGLSTKNRVGEYMLDFECVLNTGMNPKDLLMTLQIETWYRSAPSLYSEVFQMPDGSGRLYWVYELKRSDMIQLIRDYCDKYKLSKIMGVEEVFKQPRFIEEYQKVNPVQTVCISKEKMPVIYKIVNEGLPEEVQHASGADGHEYYLKTYGKTKQKYQSWVEIPKEWGVFAELIATLIEAAGWKQDYNCRFCNSVIRRSNLTVTEIPPWMSS